MPDQSASPLSVRLLAGVLVSVLSSTAIGAASAPDPRDPLEGYNRAIYSFNDGLDTMIIKPLAIVYDAAVPEPVDQGVTNFFSNLGEVRNFLNTLLQGKPGESARSLARLVINSTAGVAGFFDVATPLGIAKSEEDFGQTLGVWGSGPGPYFVLPVLGPSTVRDALGTPVDILTNPATYTNDAAPILYGVEAVDYRSDLLATEESIEGITEDEYALVRNAYLDKRAYLVSDGEYADDYDIEE